MRVLTVVLALAAMPFAAGLAQGTNPFSDPKNCGAHLNFADAAGARRADAALPHGGKHGVMDRPCSSPVPPPVQPPVEPPVVEPAPACEVTSTVPAGSLSIVGKVKDTFTGVGIANWCVQLFSELGNATAVTDASGNYVFPNLPDFTYLICQEQLSGWNQTFPSALLGGVACPTGTWLGHLFPISGGNVSNVDFKIYKP